MSFTTCENDSDAAKCVWCDERQNRSLMRQHLALQHEHAFVDAMLGSSDATTALWLKSCLNWASQECSIVPTIDHLSNSSSVVPTKENGANVTKRRESDAAAMNSNKRRGAEKLHQCKLCGVKGRWKRKHVAQAHLKAALFRCAHCTFGHFDVQIVRNHMWNLHQQESVLGHPISRFRALQPQIDRLISVCYFTDDN